ncbi:MAG: ATP-dependent RecD-like DNA helicase [Lachnospiraceae bacterium]|nr:ATP-dependent RecD-like DNA helicase [Lachnospiraceae bacterium]
MKTIKGYIDEVSWESEETGYKILRVVTDKGRETCVGTAREYGAGESVEMDGEYVEHHTYGPQFKFTAIRAVAPTDRVSVIRYLGSGAIKGLGEKMAVRIVEKFGDDTFRIIEEEPERLAEIKGISAKKAREITDQLAAKREQRSAMLFLQQFGITQALADKIYEKYGNALYNIMKNNPYRLAEEIPAVGFKKADAIAQKAGISTDSEYRIRCGLLYLLQQLAAEGHCYYPSGSLCEKTAEMLGVSQEAVKEQLPALAIDQKITIKNGAEGGRVYMRSYYQAEQYCAEQLLRLRDDFAGEAATETDLKMVEKALGIELDDLQRQAVRTCMGSGVFILSGGPGTGKTTTINAIIGLMERDGRAFVLAAPTGRAAKRMKEATGYDAQTIHRLLEIGGDLDEEGGGRIFFGRNESEPLEADCVIVDEVSMVDIHLLKALLAAIPAGSQLILVGDVDQLPSVGPGQVLKDLLGSKAFPTALLQRVFRQSGESHIVDYAHRINHGERLDLATKYPDFFLLEKDTPEVVCSYMVQLMGDVIPRKLGLSGEDIQVLTPMRKGALGVEGLNAILQERLNPPSDEKLECSYGDTVFREGDRVMQIRNDYELEWEVTGQYNVAVENGKGVFNGDVGTIREINNYLKLMRVEFDDNRTVYYEFQKLDELELAYAVTIHKSQGSEYPVVILPLLSGPRMLMTRNLLYTAVTRAKQCVILIGSSGTVQQMIDTDYIQSRFTSLKERILEKAGVQAK